MPFAARKALSCGDVERSESSFCRCARATSKACSSDSVVALDVESIVRSAAERSCCADLFDGNGITTYDLRELPLSQRGKVPKDYGCWFWWDSVKNTGISESLEAFTVDRARVAPR